MPKKVATDAKPARKRTKNSDRFMALPDAQKERIFRSYNREVPASELRRMTAAERQSWKATQARLQAGHAKPDAKAAGPKRGRGRPVVGRGARSVQVSIEAALLADADDYARAHKLKRSQMIAAGLRLVMANGVTGDTVKA